MMAPRRQTTRGMSSKGKQSKPLGCCPSTNRRSTACHQGHRLLIAIGSYHRHPIPTTAWRYVPPNNL